ncbi:hypothetical protein WME91_39810 [Sorangium sp. So ce269]
MGAHGAVHSSGGAAARSFAGSGTSVIVASVKSSSSPPRQLAIVEGATHLFEEPGTLEEVARAASAWFVRYLAHRALEATA